MKTSFRLLACLLCLTTLACKPHNDRRDERREDRTTQSGDSDQKGGRHGLGRDCRADIKQFCASAEKGPARRSCLQENIDKISAPCKAAIEARGHGRRNRD